LRQVREYMKVGDLNRQAADKYYLVHTTPSKNFSRWLMTTISLQIMWKEITLQATGEAGNKISKSEYAFKLIFEQKAWEIGSSIDSFKEKTFNTFVKKQLSTLLTLKHEY
jgi:hypothetical protein